ncbi:MAG TPA: hypothetical protein VGO67_08115 [Verrucomicrobiae bacterium]
MSAKLKMAIVLGSAAFCGLVIATAFAETTTDDGNPYSIISDKNVFHLNPPPPPPAEKEKPPDLPKVMLSGFQKIGSKMEVFLALPAKDPANTAYLALQAGEKSRDIEIVAIRDKKKEVDIINTGTPMTLTISNNGFALGGGSAPAARPGGPPTPGGNGFGNRRIPVMPPAAPPATAAAGNNNSAIIVGGSANVMENLGNYTGNAFVSGNQAPSMVGGTVPNNPAAQIANTLLSGANTPQTYRPSTPQGPPEPAEVQAAGMLIHEANGGPPAPTFSDQ